MDGECACAELAAATDGDDDRVGLIADAAPDCECEKHSVSAYSPGPVEEHETIVRMVCVPMHVHKKKAELLPNFFSHAFSKGLSAQRLERASNEELVAWLNAFAGDAEERVWLGYVEAPTEVIRQIRRVDDERAQGFCIYDAALKESPAHVEIGASSRLLEDADRLEARSKLRRAFSGGKIVPRKQLRGGAVFASLDAGLAGRQVPAQWAELI